LDEICTFVFYYLCRLRRVAVLIYDSWGPLRRLPTMWTFICTLPHLSPAGRCSVADLLYPGLSRTPRRSVYSRGRWSLFIAMTWHNAWCAGVVASSLTTWPNSAWRLLLIISAMLDKQVGYVNVLHMACHFTPIIWRWHDIWKNCNLRVSSASRVHLSVLYNRIWRTQVWYSLSLVSRLRPFLTPAALRWVHGGGGHSNSSM